ncbi:hypothetical protein [Cohnella sp. REN36]|uniref:hypothetical protein n=1 Tax=Cohnella sp. REN36 TaxID=2887347 RepID=UPI001D15A3FA|nr:hypothetical protein [Cohnella sp. REN36]MCC3376800.1 hypothetical protein [Cohnella sp. REN36]
MKKAKQPGENISLKTRKTEHASVMAWINAQTNLMDSLRYLIENEVLQHGVRNLQTCIPAERATLDALDESPSPVGDASSSDASTSPAAAASSASDSSTASSAAEIAAGASEAAAAQAAPAPSSSSASASESATGPATASDSTIAPSFSTPNEPDSPSSDDIDDDDIASWT